jgi:hypothetical protein
VHSRNFLLLPSSFFLLPSSFFLLPSSFSIINAPLFYPKLLQSNKKLQSRKNYIKNLQY